MRKTWKKLAAMAVTASMVICGGAMGVSAATEEELHTGVGGAAAATVLSQIVSVVLTAYFLVKSDFLEEKIGIRTMRICKEHMGMMINKGFPLALQSMLFPIANSIVQASINTMGTDSIAAWGICDKLDKASFDERMAVTGLLLAKLTDGKIWAPVRRKE